MCRKCESEILTCFLVTNLYNYKCQRDSKRKEFKMLFDFIFAIFDGLCRNAETYGGIWEVLAVFMEFLVS